ncbi:MAG TPA: phosphoribosylformylglycinamidine cyclo-ligase, partial [Stellaceae bacterium]|nr:phosphoribosylformylglycinamidine cyclo-ligase [Stellaceae bacterium]
MAAHNNGENQHEAAGVDIAEADAGLNNIVSRIVGTWPKSGGFGAVQLPIGYFANVIDIGGIGLAITTDGVGSKAMIADMMRKYDTIGIDCIAMNVNDLLCVGARPVSLVDYIAVEKADAAMMDGIAIGLAEGARQSNISITGGEISQLRDVVRGFDLVGTAVGTVPLDRILVGRDLQPGDRVIGLPSSGIHSNGMTLTRRVFFEQASAKIDTHFAELGCTLGEELLRPTIIYVPEILDVLSEIPSVKALSHITGDGLLNVPRVAADDYPVERHCADRGADQVEAPDDIAQLRDFAAGNRDLRLAGAFGKADRDAVKHRRIRLLDRDVIDQRHRPRADAQQVVDVHRDAVDADRVVRPH